MAKNKKKSRRDDSQQLFLDYNSTNAGSQTATPDRQADFGKRFPGRNTASQGNGRKNKGRQAPWCQGCPMIFS